MLTTNTETIVEPSTAEPPAVLAGRFGDLSALLDPEVKVPVINGKPVEEDPQAEPVAPLSMTDFKPAAESTDVRVAAEKAAAEAILRSANFATLDALAGGRAAEVAPQLKDNLNLLAWIQAEATKLKEAEAAQRTGGAVLYFELRPLERERTPITMARHYATLGRKSYFEKRGLQSAGRRYRPARAAYN